MAFESELIQQLRAVVFSPVNEPTHNGYRIYRGELRHSQPAEVKELVCQLVLKDAADQEVDRCQIVLPDWSTAERALLECRTFLDWTSSELQLDYMVVDWTWEQ